MTFKIKVDNKKLRNILSDLQNAWLELLGAVNNDMSSSETREKLIKYINEAMAWENVRNLNSMKDLLTLILNTINLECPNKKFKKYANGIQDILKCIFTRIKKGENL